MTCGMSVVFSWYSVSSTNKTDRQDITEILLTAALNTITLTIQSINRLTSKDRQATAQKENLVSTSPIIKITLVTCIVQSYCTAGAMVPCSQMLF